MKKFLIADDSTFMRQVIKKLLQELGHTVVGEAENGRIALEKYKELSPDMVTLDITMSEMDGLSALQEIIAFDQNAKVIMVSAMGQKSYVENAISLGAKGFLVKPFQRELVMSTIERLS